MIGMFTSFHHQHSTITRLETSQEVCIVNQKCGKYRYLWCMSILSIDIQGAKQAGSNVSSTFCATIVLMVPCPNALWLEFSASELRLPFLWPLLHIATWFLRDKKSGLTRVILHWGRGYTLVQGVLWKSLKWNTREKNGHKIWKVGIKQKRRTA